MKVKRRIDGAGPRSTRAAVAIFIPFGREEWAKR
jgi:hypothetical protein